MLSYSVEGFAAALGVWYYILTYGIGIIAMVLSIIAVHFKNKITIILCNFFGQACWVAHFLLQGDVTSAISCILSVAMLAVFARQNKWKWATGRVSVIVFIIIMSLFSMLGFKEWTDIFPLLAGVFAVIANSRKSEKQLRWYSLLWYVFWLANSTFKLYPVAFVNDLLCTVSTIASIILYRERRVKKPKQKTASN